MGVLDRVKGHFRERRAAPATVTVPEWRDGDEPLVIHVFPLTPRERRRIFTKTDGQPRDSAGVQVQTLIVAARAADGKPLFSEFDEHDLLNDADGFVVGRVAAEIMVRTGQPSIGRGPTQDMVDDAGNA